MSLRYKILLTERALKDIEEINNKQEQERIGRKLKEYADDPIRYAKKLVDPNTGTYRFRIGDYRIIFDIDDEYIVILRIGHRKNIYNK